MICLFPDYVNYNVVAAADLICIYFPKQKLKPGLSGYRLALISS